MSAILRRAPYALMLLLALFVALVALRYLLPGMPGGAPPVMANAFADPFLPLHAGSAAAALLIGPFQFWGRPDGRRAVWHRFTGALYMAACFVGGAAGIVLALGTTSGPIAATGFGLLGLGLIYTTGHGLRTVLARRYAEHRRWMIRSFALILAAVTLRLYLPLAGVLGYDFTPAYVVIAWLCWVPNIIIAELVFVRARPVSPALASA